MTRLALAVLLLAADSKTLDPQIQYAVWAIIINGLLAAATLAIAIAGVIQARAALRGANAATKAANVAESALRKLERAEVLLDSAGVDCAGAMTDGDAQVVVKLTNFGRSRADDVVCSLLVEVGRLPESERKPIAMPSVIIGPGDTQTICSEPFRSFLSEAAFKNAMADGEPPLTFTVVAAYTDVFGGHHRSEYEGRFRARGRTFEVTCQSAN
jgi:hypothetical protein